MRKRTDARWQMTLLIDSIGAHYRGLPQRPTVPAHENTGATIVSRRRQCDIIRPDYRATGIANRPAV